MRRKAIMYQEFTGDAAFNVTAIRGTLARTQAEHGAIGGGHTRDYNIMSDRQGTSANYLVRRLKRDAPHIAAALARGKYKSARAAAIAAGIIKPQTTLQKMLALLPKLTAAERRELATVVCTKE